MEMIYGEVVEVVVFLCIVSKDIDNYFNIFIVFDLVM